MTENVFVRWDSVFFFYWVRTRVWWSI